MSMNSYKTYKWGKIKYKFMNFKVEVIESSDNKTIIKGLYNY